ncbi:MAG: hypothetical protein GX495_03310 [Chloroflexi bacterium]|jgi:hypothetical protein|nr:hypothetical protein [Chloroflexota bacterium]
MAELTPYNLLTLMALTLFLLGIATFVAGVIILAVSSRNNEVRILAEQTTRLAQKGIAEDVAGLVGNATKLLEALNQLVRTTTGIGIFLSITGILMVAAACWLALRLFA